MREKTQTNIIGPYSIKDWKLLRSLRVSIRDYKKTERFRDAINLETSLYKERLLGT